MLLKSSVTILKIQSIFVAVALTVTYLKIPLQERIYRQSVTGYTTSYIERFVVEKKLDFLDRSSINLFAEFGHLTQNGSGSIMEFPEARSDDMPEVLLGFAGNNFRRFHGNCLFRFAGSWLRTSTAASV